MRQFLIRFLLCLVSTLLLVQGSIVYAAQSDPVYTTLRTVDLGTYNEYRYRLTEQFFALREGYEVNRVMDKEVLTEMTSLADEAYRYLPDNLKNKNYLNELFIDLKRAVKSPSNDVAYTELIKSLASYLEDVQIDSISATVDALPLRGNAPMVTTFRARASDPSGTQIKTANYTWWMDNGGDVKVIGRGPSINYTFREEGKFTVSLDIVSSHKNSEGFTDVLPLSEKIEVIVEEKIASLIVKVNGDRVKDDDLKFNPEDAGYGLLFDATSSTPTAGSRFSRTQWDFGNGITRVYNGSPKIERIRYGREGEYGVTLRLTTNEGKIVEKNFVISVRDPIARIEVNREDGYIGDKFTFAAKSAGLYRDLTYNWEIIDIENDKVVYQKNDKTLTYSFSDKGRYNIKLKVRRSNGEVDQDTRIVYVTSQAPIAEFETSIPLDHKPNRVLFDASRSFDPDLSDDGNLKYAWYIDGKKVNLEDASLRGAVGYYVFDSIGTHSVNLEVTDLDGITTVKKGTVDIDSILSVEMYAFPRVIQRENFIRFTAESEQAQVYEWDFGDGVKTGGNKDTVNHTYNTSGTYDVRLTVTDKDNRKNYFTRTVYVSESDTPLAVIDPSLNTLEIPQYDASACEGVGAYIVDRVGTVKFDGTSSINVNGLNTNLEYSWKIGQSKFSTASNVTHRFDEIGCFPVKLTVKSKNNRNTDSEEIMLQVRNLAPVLSALSVDVVNPGEDPLIVTVKAQGAKDLDGVIQSYLWYYYTTTDTEPQDFRSTVGPETAFVIPRITGDYYFVAILKDNNEAKANSEDITGSKYFTTIAGDNINTPLIDLSVNDTSTVIGEELTFTVKAKNILGKNIEKDAVFSWDFDGDGFYDTQTSTPQTSYKYRKSGDFYPKVKVKYRGMSSTKNISISVSNALTPDFEYISVGNRFIFFDTSLGQVESYSWDLGDGTKKSGTSFEHTYTDKKSSHIVKLQITEGTKVKEIEKKVVKNVRNILKKRGRDLVVFSSPEVNDEGQIVLEYEGQKAFVYLGESTQEASKYLIDYDLDYDSDLNGGMDDDADNTATPSELTGSVQEVLLSDFKTQKIRVFLKDDTGTTIASEDITLIKEYIEQDIIDPDTLVFEGVSESERRKIESLKEILGALPQHQKLEAYHYIQKLQENWNDNTEKTRTILDFEGFIFELSLRNEDEIIDLLESLLVEGQEDQSSRQITYQALINLIPLDIVCQVETGSCVDDLISKLTDIRESNNVEKNKILGKQILEVIGSTTLMSNSEKIDFKAILSSLVYGEVESIPQSEKDELLSHEQESSSDEDIGGGVLITLIKILMYIILIFALVTGALYLAYFLLKNTDEGFTEFITRVTSGGSKERSEDIVDVLSDDIKDDVFEEKEKSDILSTPIQQDTSSSQSSSSDELTQKNIVPLSSKGEKNQSGDTKKDTTISEDGEKNDVPDWLKGSFGSEDISKESQETKAPTASTSQEENKQTFKKESKEIPLKETKPLKTEKNVKQEDTFDLEKDTKIETGDESVPDWLKGSFTPNDTQEDQKEIAGKPVSPTKEVKQKDSKSQTGQKDTIGEKTQEDPNVPDWLKGSFDTPHAQEDVTPKTEEVVETQKEENKAVPKEPTVKSSNTKKTPAKKTPAKKSTEKKSTEKKTSPKKTETKNLDTDRQVSMEKKDEAKAEKEVKKEELWDNGMKVPDWLKSDTK